ncbi:MAG: tetratricopeptide repeat protein [Candidatus Riflebacteria bacterium]|nr:tetratricopeptide repeat protein [Candidatus Riflebacteria bacterium]
MLLLGLLPGLVEARPKAKVATAPAFLPEEQNQVLREEVLRYVRENADRKPGEGWLFLSRHYHDLGQPDQAMEFLRRVVRADTVAPRVKGEAQLLLAEILTAQKQEDLALKELDRLLSWNPDRDQVVRARIERARLLGRGLTRFPDLIKAFQRYYQAFPDLNELEELPYLMGFERGYDLEIGMKGLEAWEAVSRFPEPEAAQEGNLHLALLYCYDLSRPRDALAHLARIPDTASSTSAIEAGFVRATILHLAQPPGDPREALACYRTFLDRTRDLDAFRAATLLTADLLSTRLNDHLAAIEVLEVLASTPPHLAATPSISLEKRTAEEDEARAWGVLAHKMAGYFAEYRLQDPDRARAAYQKAIELLHARRSAAPDPWLVTALARTEPKISAAQMAFEQAYETYRGRDPVTALRLYDSFVASFPTHHLAREARFRAALICDDDLKEYDRALERYHHYLIEGTPRKSGWKLDNLYDWGRIDEVRYRIGNLLLLHRKDPMGALKIFEDLSAAYPDSYWAMQGMRDAVRIYREDLGDENTAIARMEAFIAKYPDHKESQEFRKNLFERHLGQGETTKALGWLKEFLDHSLPSDEGYLAFKRQWRDLGFRLREEAIRKRLPTAGDRDRLDLLENLVPVLSLASSAAPLEAFAKEIEGTEDLPDETRWALTYRIGAQLYRDWPAKGKAVFQRLAETASGAARLACLLTLGNIAYRVEKSVPDAIAAYEAAASLTSPINPMLDTPTYRLGRLYAAAGEGEKAMTTLAAFLRRFPRSRHQAKASKTLGEIYAVFHQPVHAVRAFRRALRLSPELGEKIRPLIEEAEKAAGPDAWLAARAEERALQRERAALEAAASGAAGLPLPTGPARRAGGPAGPLPTDRPLTDEEIRQLDVETLYEAHQREAARLKPDAGQAVKLVLEILRRKAPPALTEKALRHYVSWRFFRKRDGKAFVTEAQELLTTHNYAAPLADLLFRMAQARDHFLKDYEEANKAYFEYLSFFPNGRYAQAARERIPQVYEAAGDGKNALRFYDKVIDDPALPGPARVEASLRKAKMQEKDQRKNEAVQTLEAALAFDSLRQPEIYLRLEKLTGRFDYVARALQAAGEERFRFQALQRLVKKAEKDLDFDAAADLVEKHGGGFQEPEAQVWIEKKRGDLAKRGTIAEIEQQIEQFPEEPDTPARLFRLATMVEGAEHTKYRSQDLFYEITLVYPHSEFFRESKIRAENTRAIRSLEELDTMLKKGVKPEEGEEILLERGRLYQEALQDTTHATENYEATVALGPTARHRGEALLKLGELALARDQAADKALSLWEQGLSATQDPELREQLTRRINSLRRFREKLLFSEHRADHDEGTQELFRVWRLEGDRAFALSMVDEALGKLENRPQTARLLYWRGRLLEETGKPDEALAAYEKALRSLYHPGCRKDMLLYRMARLHRAAGRKAEAIQTFAALANRYPRSLLSRSALYALYLDDLAAERFTAAHLRLNQLLQFHALAPVHRQKIVAWERDLTARMNIHEMERLRRYSRTGASDFPYFVGKVMENDLRDHDRAIAQYEAYLRTNPTQSRSRDLMIKIADLYEQKKDWVKAVGYLDALLRTLTPAPQNLDLILRIGNLVEDRLANPDLADLFWNSIADEYKQVPAVRTFARAKLRALKAKRLVKAAKPRAGRKLKREYTDEDQDILDALAAIRKRQIDELQDYPRAEREMVELWDESLGSVATLDIMKELVTICDDLLMDPQKGAEYMQRWLDENPDDPELPTVTMQLYEAYMTKLQDGQKALALLETFVRNNPTSPMADEANLKIGKANEQLIRNFDEARRVYQRIIDTKRNDPLIHEAYFRMGFVLREGFADYAGAVAIWEEMNNLFYQNSFAADAQFAIAYTYEVYQRNYTKARENYERLLNQYPNSPLQNQVREALLRISGK